ncbi:TonB-dependent receptor [Fulvivirga sediminis]|uniref:TonB-dependent receptor n=1 Tax=Fulvivirga sediminis TaxID=2803949 RepID=A0A937F7H3_9BACT|nr:TonB-dependent receptor [Fulvivirga sediminis]MBL3657857.1 TonB-dependent receptor [Fulvivirga sediminis]
MKKILLKSMKMLGKYLVYGLIIQALVSNLLLASTTSAQSVYKVKISLKRKQGKLSQFFQEIEQQSEYRFTYSKDRINLQKEVNINKPYQNLGELLSHITNQGDIIIKQINYNLIVSKAKPTLINTRDERGIITGRVTDSETGDILPGATVKVSGTNYGAASNTEGEYSLRVNSGEVSIEVSYIGFQTVTETISIKEGETIVKDFTLKSNTQELDAVMVVGILQGQAKALNQQKTADNIKNIVAAEQIGRFPDPNVAEALQRVPAISVERDQGEGRYVLVRGLAPQFTNININGAQIPSPEAGVRFIALDAIPADQLASIEVSKALTPDMDGDAIGGSVNLITRTAKTRNASFSGNLVGGYNNLMDKPNAQGSLQYGQRFGKSEQLGILLNSSYYFTDRGSDNWERDGSELEFRDYELTRTRLGLSGTIDYHLSENSEIYVRGIYNRFTDREWRRRYVFVPNADNSPFEDNEIERSMKDRFESQTISSVSLGGKHAFPKLAFDYEVSYSDAQQDTPFDNEVNFIGKPDQLSTDFSDSKWPVMTSVFEDEEALVNGSTSYTPQNAYLNNNNYEFDELETGNTLAKDRNISGKFNINLPYTLANNEAALKFGGKVRLKDKSLSVTQNTFEWEGADDLLLSQFEGGLVDQHFLDDHYQIAAHADMGKVLRFFNANRSGFALDTESKIEDENSESYEAEEDVYAAYIMSKIQFIKLMLLGGVRYEHTNVNYKSNSVIYDEDGDFDEVLAEEGGTSYDFILPQVHLKYNLNNTTNLRAAATFSYARPNFEDIVPQNVIELREREGTIGNPKLEPVSAFNLDLMGEKYFGTIGIISGGLFYKRLDNFIYSRTNYQTIDDVTNMRITQSVNGGGADLVGIEVAYQQNMTFLPGKLKGLGLYLNYTYTASNAELIREENKEEINLPGQSKHVGNISISYDLGKFNTRISANYRGSYLQEIGSEPDEDIYLSERLQLDWTMGYAINNKFRVFAEFLNLTNAPFEAYMGNEDMVIQREFYSWWSRIGLKFDL